jgi:hypothetical protein
MYKKMLSFDGTEQQAVKRLSDNACIPFDPANTDYQEYLKWVAEGNLPIPAESTDDSSNHEPLPADGE